MDTAFCVALIALVTLTGPAFVALWISSKRTLAELDAKVGSTKVN